MKTIAHDISLVALATIIAAGVTMPASAQRTTFVPPWVQDAVFYQIFPERFANGDAANDPPGTGKWGGTPTPGNFFGGDLRGIINHLDHLSSLGVNALYLNPIFAAASNHKYDTGDYLRIDPAFGDEQTFRELVDSCHARGIRVVLDGVFNHTGVEFFAFADLKKNGANSKYTGWYNVRSFPVGPVSKPNYECWWNIGTLPKLMTGNPGVRQYLFEVTRHWLAAGIDGWRLDVPNEIPHEFWIEWRRLVKSLNPRAYILGEIWDNGAPWLQGDQFDAVMNYRFRSACIDFFASGTTSVSAFDSALTRQRADYAPEVNFALFNPLGSHDTERFLTLCRGNIAAWKLALLFQMTYPGAPSVYYGDEIGMTGGKDPGCRGTMVWDPALQNADMLGFTRGVIALRRSHDVLRRGSFAPLVVDDARGVYAFLRAEGSSGAAVVLNRSSDPRTVLLGRGATGGFASWKQIWPVVKNDNVAGGDSLTVAVPARTGVVYLGEK
jgi:cyclomaltodextrinase / maltogenic alpha-amylase / neopullulanase